MNITEEAAGGAAAKPADQEMRDVENKENRKPDEANAAADAAEDALGMETSKLLLGNGINN